MPAPQPSGADQRSATAAAPPATLFRNQGLTLNNALGVPPLTTTVQADSITAGARLNLPLPFYNLQMQRGFDPQNADLKVGPFFFKLQSLTGGVLWTDNINLSESDRESGVIAITRISGAIVAQLTETLRFSLAGSFVYLPLENEAGFTGFGLYAPLIFGLENPIFRAEASWNTTIGDWNVLFADDFTIGLFRYWNNFRDDALLFAGGEFDGIDQAGRYAFGANGQVFRDNDRQDFRTNEQNVVFFSNTVSAQADRLIVGKTRLRVQAFHQNLWYNQGNRGLPSLRDQVNVSLISEKENLRFKPFATYTAFRTNRENSFGQTLMAGLDGPITDQLQLRVGIGYFLGTNRENLLWQVNLRHQAGPYTYESLYYRRFVSPFYDQINEVVGYNIRQILGPKVTANAFIFRNEVDWLGANDFSETQYVTGLSLQIRAGPRTQFTLVGTASRVEYEDRDYRTLTGLAQVTHYFTDTFLARLLYQYQQRDSGFRDDDYYENMVFFSLTKFFN